VRAILRLMRRIHLFRAGAHTPMRGGTLEFSAADLDAMARAYATVSEEAPLVVGHPPTDAPAYGWVKTLTSEPDGLFAEPHQVEPAFADMVRDGRFKKVSIALYTPRHPQNPSPGAYYLKHVGFLGAAAPAVKGLKPVQFAADDDQVVTLEFGVAEEPHVVSIEFAVAANATTPPEAKDRTVNEEDAARRAEELASRERAIAEREAAFAQREAERVDADNRAFVQDLVRQGRLPQGLAPRVAAFMGTLSAEVEIAFVEPDGRGSGSGAKTVKQPQVVAFREMLSGLPAAVAFRELAGGQGPGAGDAPVTAEFAGRAVDPDRMALHAKALAYQKANPAVDYVTAALAVEKAG
jgi:hypothetical protein